MNLPLTHRIGRIIVAILIVATAAAAVLLVVRTELVSPSAATARPSFTAATP